MLSFEDRVKLLFVPPPFYYAHKVAKEARRGEPELDHIGAIAPKGRRAIDIGANRGIYSYALSRIASRVDAFEPNPNLAHFSRTMLGRRATVHQIAIGRADGKAILHVPCEPNGQERHLLASLAAPRMGLSTLDVEVDVRRLDQFGYENVGFIKIDIEGTELDALEGAEATIRNSRPNLLIELLAGHYPRPLDQIAAICGRFDYRASIMVGPESIPAAEALESLRGRLRTRNVLFTPAT